MALSAAEKSRRYRLAHPERVKASGAAWAKRNPLKVNAKARRWRKLNPEKARPTPERKAAKAIRYRINHADHLREYHKRYRATHKERLHQYEQTKWLVYREMISQRNHVASQKRRAWLNTQKDHPCLDCGGRFPPCAMDFDHVRGNKSWTIGQLFNAKESRVLEEISKCDLVCANCHRIRTHNRRKTLVTEVA